MHQTSWRNLGVSHEIFNARILMKFSLFHCWVNLQLIIFNPRRPSDLKGLGMDLKGFDLILDGKFLLFQVGNMNVIPPHAVGFIVQHFFYVLMLHFKVVNAFLSAVIQFSLLN